MTLSLGVKLCEVAERFVGFGLFKRVSRIWSSSERRRVLLIVIVCIGLICCASKPPAGVAAGIPARRILARNRVRLELELGGLRLRVVCIM